nr:SMP-30/gluconolactonase/LRE family protein [Bacteroidota bacterium]
IYLWSEDTQKLSVFLEHSDSSNGLTLDSDGRLVLTQMLKRRVARRERDGTIIPLAETFRGKKFNSPNDVVVKSDGSIFFTDPDFNVPSGQKKELAIKGIYRISPGGTVQLLDSTFDKPNGICFSPDEKKLYVNESAQCKIYVWDVLNDSTIANKKLFYTIPLFGYADGMKVDTAGNLYCTGPTGVWIISPQGTLLGKIATPLNPSNCAWGESARTTLYITAGNGNGQGVVYRIRLSKPSKVNDHSLLFPNAPELYQNFPNPFNPSTCFQYQLYDNGYVTFDVFDLYGRNIQTLFQGNQQAGFHSIYFDGSQLSSGAYIYRLAVQSDAGKLLSSSKRFILLK